MSLVCCNYHVFSLIDNWVLGFVFYLLELLYVRKNYSSDFSIQQLSEVLYVICLLGVETYVGECVMYLFIQRGTVCQHNDCWIFQLRHFTDLVCVENHCEGFARTLSMPYDTYSVFVGVRNCLLSVFNGFFNSIILVISGQNLVYFSFLLLIDDKVSNYI